MTNDEVHLIVVDAANVVGSRPNGWWRDRPGAARRLLTQLSAANPIPEHPTEVLVVLEGAAKAAITDPGASEFEPLHVVMAPGSGDDEIVRVVAEARAAQSNRPITVVTADRGLRDRVEPLGATTVGPRWLLDRITQ
ncbi:hypothetical protein AB0N05_35835 [Nocardia sp. NPDC051030]|uniref:hypothetical protein n=1 Tax=Nocardia sp. NPDC051030 TaxID=3155162 RepID=UPI003447EC6A